ncbi:hypothetical protein LINPERHAP2_LOCUS39341, partial [Linum perenne]
QKKKRTRESATPGSAYGGGGGSESDAVPINASPSLAIKSPATRGTTCNPKGFFFRVKQTDSKPLFSIFVTCTLFLTKSDDGGNETRTSAAGEEPTASGQTAARAKER